MNIKSRLKETFKKIKIYFLKLLYGKAITACWYKKHKNFGDLITPEIIKYFGFKPIHIKGNLADLYATGSILKAVPDNYQGTIIGSGLMSETEKKFFPIANILAVRGKETLKNIGSPKEVFLGDPGLLIKKLYSFNGVHKKFKIGIIPHYVDMDSPIIKRLALLHSAEDLKIIDVKRNPKNVAYDIVRCKYILSSSLHGIIAADSFHIPNAWILLSKNVAGRGFKFHDYNSALGVEQKYKIINGDESIEDLVNLTIKKPAETINEITEQLEKIFHDYFEKKSVNYKNKNSF